jgi:queuosine precursor transporter
MLGIFLTASFAATIPLANWMISNVGVCVPAGPCLIPVGFGLMAPSGVLVVGASLVLRDAVHSVCGWRWALAAILAGAAMSWVIASPALALASAVAFLLSETADMAVYAPLRERRLWLAVLLSGGIGAAVDSVAFLWLAFGSLDFVAGQIIGKFWMTIAAMIAILSIRSTRSAQI